jgi:hypothetical protein
MKHDFRSIPLAALAASFLLLGAGVAGAQEPERRFLEEPKQGAAEPAGPPPAVLSCTGPITKVIDVAYENVKTTSTVFGGSGGGGVGGKFDKIPVLSTKVKLGKETCLNAHFSVIVGNGQLYGRSRMALFQVTVTGTGGPQAMVGHYPTPFGIPSPAVALEAERDVDMLGANFFQKVGSGPHEVPPGIYNVDVWWAGGPPGPATPSGVIGMAFVLKLYLR